MKVVILAGGLGTRISEESYLRPKPAIEIGGFPILWHIMKIFSHYGFNDFIICLGYKGNVIKEFFANYSLYMSDVTFDFRNGGGMETRKNVAEPWTVTLVDTGLETQTGGRVKRVQKYIGEEPFLLTYGDGVSSLDINKLVDYHKAGNKLLTVTAVQPGGRYGALDIEDGTGQVLGFAEKTKEDGGWINAGFMVVQPEVFHYLTGDECVFERGPMEQLSISGQMQAYRYSGFWQCMDTQRDKILLENLWQGGNAPWCVWQHR